jgi:chemotaxis protein MotB
MARKKKHEEHENHERWLISYADFITLLFAFFVVMYSVSAVNEGKFRVLSEALAAAFRSQPKSLEPIQVGVPAKSPRQPNSKMPTKAQAAAIIMAPRPAIQTPKLVDAPESKIQTPAGASVGGSASGGSAMLDKAAEQAFDQAVEGIRKRMAKMATEIEGAMKDLIDEDLIVVRRDKHGLWVEVEIKSSILFASGSTDLGSDSVKVLWKIANVLREYPYPIQVEGFTDNVPINTVAYPSNWELSAGRAASVVHLFMDAGIPPDNLVAVGYGEYRPVGDNSTEEGRQKNRRVVLVILADTNAQRIIDMQRREEAEAAAPAHAKLELPVAEAVGR